MTKRQSLLEAERCIRDQTRADDGYEPSATGAVLLPDGFLQGNTDTEVEFAGVCPGGEEFGDAVQSDVGALGNFCQDGPGLIRSQAPERHDDTRSLIDDRVDGPRVPRPTRLLLYRRLIGSCRILGAPSRGSGQRAVSPG